jgi:hypothetical protein
MLWSLSDRHFNNGALGLILLAFASVLLVCIKITMHIAMERVRSYINQSSGDMTYAVEAATETFKASTSTEPSSRRIFVLLEIGIVVRGECVSGVAEAKRGTTAMIVASEKYILSRVELV